MCTSSTPCSQANKIGLGFSEAIEMVVSFLGLIQDVVNKGSLESLGCRMAKSFCKSPKNSQIGCAFHIQDPACFFRPQIMIKAYGFQ